MLIKAIQTLLLSAVYALAFDDIYVNGEISHDLVEKGRTQYQLLKERGSLPQYGTCWKSAVEHVDEGCRHLSEETQSDIALHLANCFLEMSGHETYKCAADKKPNLRAICISNMSDRAFNVYTEFYTHTQNICWFLRGQIWHETISENTFKVGKQLETSAENQESLLKAQQESMAVQEKILRHGKLLEGVLEELYVSTKAHQEILEVMTASLGSLQAWLVGEVSWFDSVLFYTLAGIFTFIFTASKRTADARLVVLFALFLNITVERLICFFFIWDDPVVDAGLLYKDIYLYVWYCRYVFVLFNVFYLLYHVYCYKDLLAENYRLLAEVSQQNTKILSVLEMVKNASKGSPLSDKFDLVNENSMVNNLSNSNGFLKGSALSYSENRVESNSYKENRVESNSYKENSYDREILKDSRSMYSDIIKDNIRSRRNYSPRAHMSFTESQSARYNLRSKQNTPSLN